MTENDIKYGCLSKSLVNFLEMHEDDRKKKYRKGEAKYYQRIVKSVEGSFRDIILAYSRLPSNYSRKINLQTNFNVIRDEIMLQQSAKDRASFSIGQAKQGLEYILTRLNYSEKMTNLFRDDFEKVHSWLVFLNSLEPELRETES